MKTLFLETKYDGIVRVPSKVINKLPNKIGLFFTLQFIDSLDSVKKQLEDSSITVKIFKTKHTKYKGQIYGCNLQKYDGVDGYLYIGDGLFHPKALVLGNDKPVHIWNPINKKYSVITKDLMDKEIKRQKAAYSSFLMKKKIGVLLSTKNGQSYYKHALKLKTKYPDKEFYYITYNTIDFSALEDFPFIEFWVNTACPRLGWDDTKRANKPMVDLETIF